MERHNSITVADKVYPLDTVQQRLLIVCLLMTVHKIIIYIWTCTLNLLLINLLAYMGVNIDQLNDTCYINKMNV